MFPDLGEKRKAVPTLHMEIRENQIVISSVKQGECFVAAVGHINDITILFEDGGGRYPDVLVIVNDEKYRRGFSGSGVEM